MVAGNDVVAVGSGDEGTVDVCTVKTGGIKTAEGNRGGKGLMPASSYASWCSCYT